MPDQPDNPDLFAELLDRMEQEGDDALERICAEHPGSSEELRRKVRRLRDMGLLGDATSGPPPATTPHRMPERLGEFVLREPLGGGGMGVVYVAHQDGLDREVALKLIRPEHLFFPGMRDRFRREVETIARMQHPGIVPIYTVGIDGEIPYFAMERVVGANLSEVIAGLVGREARSLRGADVARVVASVAGVGAAAEVESYLFAGGYEETCLRIIRQAAEALDHAHQRGVLHRDIKPSNIMVTPAGRVLLLDFGLATMEGKSRLTRTGSQMGSIHYASPEQARGEFSSLDARSDVYSLGVTLFELLTLTHAFDGDSVHQIQQSIVRGLPRAPRAINTAISWETETVCLTAVDLDKRRRYQRAADFARDIQNVLEHRSIEARRVGLARRTLRLCQRHPAAAVAVALLALSLVGYAAMQQRSLSQVRVERDRARANLDTLLRAIDDMLVRFTSERLANTPMVTQLRRELSEIALKSLEGLLGAEGDRPEVIEQTALAHGSAGQVYVALEQDPEALHHFQRSIELTERLGERASLRGRLVAARAHQEAAWIHHRAGRGQLAEDATTAALHEFERLEPRATESPGVGAGIANAYRARGTRAAEESRVDDAVRDLERSLEVLGRTREQFPNDYRLAADELVSSLNLASMMVYVDQAAAVRQYAEAVSAADALLAKHPEDLEARRMSALARTNQGLSLVHINKAADGVAALKSATDAWRDLVRSFPARPEFRFHLGSALLGFGEIRYQFGDSDGALEPLQEARRHLARLCDDYADNVTYLAQLAAADGDLGDTYFDLDDIAHAEASYRAAEDALRRLIGISPDNAIHHAQLGLNLDGQASIARDRGDAGEARRLYGEALTCHRRAIELNPGDPMQDEWYATARGQLLQLLLTADDHARAAEVAVEGIQLLPGNPRALADGAAALAACAELAGPDNASGYVDDAIDAIRAAEAAGLPHFREWLDSDPLAPLRGDPRFEAMRHE